MSNAGEVTLCWARREKKSVAYTVIVSFDVFFPVINLLSCEDRIILDVLREGERETEEGVSREKKTWVRECQWLE